VIRYLERKGVCFVKDWPPYSPDLSPIEELWGELERRRSEQFGVAATQDELKQQLREIWKAIPQSVIDNFVASFRTKLRRCVAARGM
jgi:transposase